MLFHALPFASRRTVDTSLDDILGESRTSHSHITIYCLFSQVTDLWIDDMYLKNSIPLPVNSNPFYLLPRQVFRSSFDQLKFAVKVLQFCHQFKQKIDTESLSQEYGSGHGSGLALCMDSYRNFFGCCRIPGPEKDTLWTPHSSRFSSSTDSRTSSSASRGEDVHFHRIIVAARNQFFLLKLSDADFNDETLILDCLRCIAFLSKEKESSAALIGILTSDNRRTWASVRSHMLSSESSYSLPLCFSSWLISTTIIISYTHLQQAPKTNLPLKPLKHLNSSFVWTIALEASLVIHTQIDIEIFITLPTTWDEIPFPERKWTTPFELTNF